jgi:hypothetical protein
VLQSSIDLIDPLSQADEGRNHLFFQQRDLFFPVGMIDLAAQQGPLTRGSEDLQHALQLLVRQDKLIADFVKRGDGHQGHRDGTAGGVVFPGSYRARRPRSLPTGPSPRSAIISWSLVQRNWRN